jgi:hypothetical protein
MNPSEFAQLDYEVDITHPQIPGDISYGALTFYRNKNPNGLSPTLHEDDDRGPWLRLGVARDAYLGATDGCPTKCDRCELRDDKLPLGDPGLVFVRTAGRARISDCGRSQRLCPD